MNFEIESPLNKEELLKTLSNLQSKKFRFGAGFTDLLIEFKKFNPVETTVINLAQLKDEEFCSIRNDSGEIQIGSLVKLAQICKDTYIKDNFPVLHQAANALASGQIREVATVGGNICQASPSGDLSCALVSLKANCEILNIDGKIRNQAISEFFKGPGKTSLQKNEILKSISIPINHSKNLKSGYIKIGKRSAMECSIVSLAYHFQLEKNGKVKHAGIAIGAVGPTIIFCQETVDFLLKQNINNIDEVLKLKIASMIQNASSPIDDARASAWYRHQVLYNVAKSLFE
ncbi:MAG: hypothetical protein AUJ98_08575 [Bacteroidetes bacterium CG2_30_33_31]|nr:MAG: hypothetical protein AUJ98_08575 [Bacteroidetes bacterium CG2_30_33_31]